MNTSKSKILGHLASRFQRVGHLLQKTPNKTLNEPRGDKWSVGQLIYHMVLTTASVASMLKLNAEMAKERFGTARKSTRSEEDLTQFFTKIYDQPQKAPDKYDPKAMLDLNKESLIADWGSILPKFKERLANWEEEDLDQCVAPHPVFGELTFREHLYVAIFHIDHHLQQLADEGLGE